jgi:hypothetical protein
MDRDEDADPMWLVRAHFWILGLLLLVAVVGVIFL